MNLNDIIYFYPAIILSFFPISAMAENTSKDDSLNNSNVSVQTGWESRYVTEGRDNLDTKNLQSASIDVQYGYFGILIWNGWGYDSDYDELNIIPFISYDKNGLSIYFSYNRKQFFLSDQSDNEIGSGISYHGLPHDIFLNADWYHSFEAEGSFFEFSIGTEMEPVNELSLETLFIFGINDNYISDGHNGANHISFQLNGEYPLKKRINLLGYMRYNVALDSNPKKFAGDELLKDFFWAGVGISISF